MGKLLWGVPGVKDTGPSVYGGILMGVEYEVVTGAGHGDIEAAGTFGFFFNLDALVNGLTEGGLFPFAVFVFGSDAQAELAVHAEFVAAAALFVGCHAGQGNNGKFEAFGFVDGHEGDHIGPFGLEESVAFADFLVAEVFEPGDEGAEGGVLALHEVVGEVDELAEVGEALESVVHGQVDGFDATVLIEMLQEIGEGCIDAGV